MQEALGSIPRAALFFFKFIINKMNDTFLFFLVLNCLSSFAILVHSARYFYDLILNGESYNTHEVCFLFEVERE
jgi:hypothetical protein